MSWEQACGLVKSAKKGSCYLVSPTTMVTCQHVVGDLAEVEVLLKGKPLQAKVERVDQDLDLALLRLNEPVAGIEPLRFASNCPPDTRWRTSGFPALADGLQIPMEGYVAQADGTDSLGQASVVLYGDSVRDQGQTVAGFSGSPVLVNGLVVGNIKRIVENPDKPGWPLYGLLWATPSTDILKFLSEEAAGVAESNDSRADPLEGVRNELESIVSAEGVYGLWNSLHETGAADEEFSIRAAHLLVSKGQAGLALELAKTLGSSFPSRRLRAFVVGKSKPLEEAIQMFETLEREGGLDADSGGMLAGLYRRMWVRSKEVDDAWRRKSTATYQQYWESSGDTYCGINAAAMLLQEGEKAASRRTLIQVVAKLDQIEKQQPTRKPDHWALATRAEAALLLEDFTEARKLYGQAKGAAAGKDQDIAVMWKSARLDLKILGQPENLFDSVLRPRTVAAFFGHSVDSPGQPERFPAKRLEAVRQRIRAKIQQHRVGFGVCSACRGGDLLFLDELIKQNGSARLVLTSPPEQFSLMFVGQTWQHIFDGIIKSGRVGITVLEPGPNAWKQVRETVRDQVERLAESLECSPLLIAAWDGSSTNYVGETVAIWETSGFPVERVSVGESDKP